MLLYGLGEDVLSSTNILEEDGKMQQSSKYAKMLSASLRERAGFNKHNQLKGETAEEYITALYALIKTCNYKAELQDQMLQDRLVVGIHNKALSTRQAANGGQADVRQDHSTTQSGQRTLSRATRR